jgi:hypothetical protein
MKKHLLLTKKASELPLREREREREREEAFKPSSSKDTILVSLRDRRGITMLKSRLLG